jgi:FKBP-type peptidyl-prolyl cis-trans isomerase 2
MRIFIISAFLLALASCALPSGNKETPTEATQTWTETSPVAIVEKVVSSGSLTSLNYTLRDGAADGVILETTLESVARANNLYTTGATYKPFQVMIGSNSVIVGFEKGLIGMKKGEKKLIMVPPAEGYGTEPRLQEVPKSQIAPVFTITQPMKAFGDVISQTVQKSQLNDEMKNSVLGQTLTGANGATAKVTAVTPDSITFDIENVDNPFYKKDIKVGAITENQAATFKITSIEKDEVTIEVTNKQSPFYNKKFEVGESLELPQGGKISIVSIDNDKVTIGEQHPMAGKTLFFDVEITEVQ